MVNNYGEENINYITEKVLKKLIYYPPSAIPKLIAMKHLILNIQKIIILK